MDNKAKVKTIKVIKSTDLSKEISDAIRQFWYYEEPENSTNEPEYIDFTYDKSCNKKWVKELESFGIVLNEKVLISYKLY